MIFSYANLCRTLKKQAEIDIKKGFLTTRKTQPAKLFRK